MSFGSTDLLGFGEFGPTNSIVVSLAGSQLDTGSNADCVTPLAHDKAVPGAGLVPYPVRYTLPGASQLEKIFPLEGAPIPNSPFPFPTVVEVNPSEKNGDPK